MNSYSQSDGTKKSSSPSANAALSLLTVGVPRLYIDAPINTTFAPNMISPSQGGGQPHQNQQPYLGVNFCIALQGIYPSFP
jgi:microcystin-dependent protein